MFISAKVGEWKDALGAVESLLNMDKWAKVEEPVLEIMLKEVIDSKDEVLVAKLAQLMARIVHRQSLNSKVGLTLAGWVRAADILPPFRCCDSTLS